MLFGVIRSLSTDETTVTLLFAAFFGLIGYRISWRHRVLRGVTPWRFPSAVWALICFVIGPIGILVELVAEITTKPRLPSSLTRIPIRFDSSARMANAQGAATIQGVATTLPVAAPVPTGPPPPLNEHGTTASFGWYGDPKARHQLRYFDGRGWTQFVADDGNRSEDPL